MFEPVTHQCMYKLMDDRRQLDGIEGGVNGEGAGTEVEEGCNWSVHVCVCVCVCEIYK